jgi:hypothetical protein
MSPLWQGGTHGEFQDEANHFGETYAMADGDLLLVRPDGYVGALVTAAHAARIAEYLSKVVSPQVTNDNR